MCAVLLGLLATGQTLILEGGGGVQSATVTFSESAAGLRLELDWLMPETDPAPTERYHAWLEDQINLGRPAVEVFDTSITYDVMNVGCAGTCLVAKVDVQARAALFGDRRADEFVVVGRW